MLNSQNAWYFPPSVNTEFCQNFTCYMNVPKYGKNKETSPSNVNFLCSIYREID